MDTKQELINKFAKFLHSGEKDRDLEDSIHRDLKRLNLSFGPFNTGIDFDFINKLNDLFKRAKKELEITFDLEHLKRKAEYFCLKNSDDLNIRESNLEKINSEYYSSYEFCYVLNGDIMVDFIKRLGDSNVHIKIIDMDNPDSFKQGDVDEYHVLNWVSFSTFIENLRTARYGYRITTSDIIINSLFSMRYILQGNTLRPMSREEEEEEDLERQITKDLKDES